MMREVGIWGMRVVDEGFVFCSKCGRCMTWLGAAWCCLKCDEEEED